MSHPTDGSCIFCKIVAGTVPSFKLYEDEHTIAFMDINPASEGHALAVAKGHWPTIFDVPADVMGKVAETAHRVANGVNKALKPDGVNLIQSNGRGAAQSVMHLHIHVLPRKIGDRLAINWDMTPGDANRIKAVHQKILAAMG